VGTGLGPRDIDRIVGITKAYTTRVGAGPFPTELLDDDGDTLVDVGREYGTVTGRRRRAGWLDCVMLRQAVRLNSLTELALTKLDILDGFETIKICTGYWLHGGVLEDYPDRSDLLAEVEPIYETIDGWGSMLSDKREPGELPREAQQFLQIVEREVGIPVRVVGVGAERDDYLVWAS
jgi:adenylosuccinate synthase